WIVNGIDRRGMAELLPWNHFLIAQRNLEDSEHVYLRNPVYEGRYTVGHVELKRVNTLTGVATTVPRPEHVQHWMLDQKGEPRMAISLERDIESVHYRDPATAQWRKLVSFNAYTGSYEGFTPLAFGPGGTLFVETNGNSDRSAVHTFNFATGKVNPEAKVSTDKYDFDGELIINREKVLGVRVTTDARTTVWFDPRMQALQKTVDSLLPDTENLISVSVRPETPWVLVEAYSDLRPRTYLLFNSDTKAFRKIGSTHPDIDPNAMGRQQTVSYKARDGLSIPALLTLPPGSKGKNLPLVVLVHGGPFTRGTSWGWDAETQFLASRGYAVLEPEYRGSTGFGHAHFQAGWKQWGLKMQDDIADGAKWAIAQGIASAKRICIAGASYGGYATLMGLVNDPDLYQCGINWVGVTDSNLMYDGHWTFASDLPERYLKYGMPQLVGDQVADAAQLKATSPLLQAARIKRPLLLAYGGADRRVPAYHGDKFHQAVKQHNPDVEWILYPAEGHGWHLPETRIDFWTRVEAFLNRHIGTP
ncbi:MAG: prolyl oligopeptidase family serine peptidase, partial [Telluria sp.]|nr:prolyl oligopeptidase family serine peptidase [Telluria sp.]